MRARFVQRGGVIEYIPAYDVAAGEVIVQGELVGVARRDIRADTPGPLTIAGIFDIPKSTGVGTEIRTGTKVYWNASRQTSDLADGGGANKYLGKAIKTADDNAAYVRVLLSQA
ncbi:MAG: DUF2190 family protein [Phycisphaerae bacterium]|nr:DUF2190 family protein [Phycisphaerae bacterium]